MTPIRKYRLRERAPADDDDRLRIVAAATRLYEQGGPAGATIRAIADAAGMRTVEVLRHFPGEAALVQACVSRWLGDNPPPDPESWAAERNARNRVSAALRNFHTYYASSTRMLSVAFAHRDDTPSLEGPIDALSAFTLSVAADLAGAFPPLLGDLIAERLEHALAFPAWLALDADGLDDPAKIALIEADLDEVLTGLQG